MVILCDFDDTVAGRNIATLLLDRFHHAPYSSSAGAGGVPFFAVETGERDGRPTFSYPYADPACGWYPGNCKCAVLESHRELTDFHVLLDHVKAMPAGLGTQGPRA